jgi:hypothetical protein
MNRLQLLWPVIALFLVADTTRAVAEADTVTWLNGNDLGESAGAIPTAIFAWLMSWVLLLNAKKQRGHRISRMFPNYYERRSDR